MFFNLMQCLFFLFFYTLGASALTFEPVVGPYAPGAPVQLEWTLDGSEPTDGWQLWFTTGAAGVRLANIAPRALSIVVPFPGSGNGTFQALSGVTVLATTNEVDEATPAGLPSATATFSPSVVSGPTNSAVSSTTSPVASPSASKIPGTSTGALLGVIVGTLAVIAIIVVASISLFVQRRRRARENRYPFAPGDVEKQQQQLSQRITPFNAQQRPPMRSTSLSPPSGDSRRQAYLNSQLQRLAVAQPDAGNANADSVSIVFGPLSSVPSETPTQQQPGLDAAGVQLPPIPESGSRRDAYLSQQLQRLAMATDVARRRPSDDGSVVFSPLSSVPSTEGTVRPYAPSISTTTTTDSPIQFRREAPTSPVVLRPVRF
ncbi:hypothetical protein B0H11DRAFT_2189407 [Mycena galericulata]|nr:hypothetical protein B0H11DRAFT_2189407 [Mycena galericulata]